MGKIKALIADGSAVYRDFLHRLLSSDPMFEVIGKASNIFIARDKIFLKKPDVLILDIDMPGGSILDFIRRVMLENPLPVIILSSLKKPDSNITLRAIQYGAVDFVLKASASNITEQSMFINELKEKIKSAINVDPSKYNIKNDNAAVYDEVKKNNYFKKKSDRIIAIGASLGGTQALTKIIKRFHEDMPGTVIVQHMPPVFTKMFAESLNSISRVKVKEAENGDILFDGNVYIAPGGLQMTAAKKLDHFELSCKPGQLVNGHCPSVDVLFESVAKSAGSRAIGIILTGMGKDGAQGLLKMRLAGARTMAQDEASSIVFGMPNEAFKCGGAQKLVSLNDIPKNLNYILK